MTGYPHIPPPRAGSAAWRPRGAPDSLRCPGGGVPSAGDLASGNISAFASSDLNTGNKMTTGGCPPFGRPYSSQRAQEAATLGATAARRAALRRRLLAAEAAAAWHRHYYRQHWHHKDWHQDWRSWHNRPDDSLSWHEKRQYWNDWHEDRHYLHDERHDRREEQQDWHEDRGRDQRRTSEPQVTPTPMRKEAQEFVPAGATNERPSALNPDAATFTPTAARPAPASLRCTRGTMLLPLYHPYRGFREQIHRRRSQRPPLYLLLPQRYWRHGHGCAFPWGRRRHGQGCAFPWGRPSVRYYPG